MLRYFVPLILSAWLAVVSPGFSDEVNDQDTGFLENGVTAHRGNSGEEPENTLRAFRSALELGVDWLELDIFRTADGQIVVTHDAHTGRLGDKKLVVAESTYDQLKEVDVATDFRRRHGKTIEECPPARMPLLEEVLELVKTQRHTRLSIQPKVDCITEAIAIIRRMESEPWAGFNDGKLEFMAKVKRLAPEIPVFWDRGMSNIDEDLKAAKQHGFEAIILHHAAVTPEKVAKIQGAGLKVGAWTVNDEATMRRMLELGIEQIYTDHPRKLFELKGER